MAGAEQQGATAASATASPATAAGSDHTSPGPDDHIEYRPRADGRRILLVIYIHGYMGKDTSFRSFPAHVHELLKLSLASHAIHTKIYPRYKTYKYIDVAAENFSRWLEPHEAPDTDIILIGHSMGGLLAADVVLLKPREGATPAHPGFPFRHRILGMIALDSPFLGLHPGIIAAGIASLFRKAPPAKTDDGGSLSPTSPRSPGLPPLSPGLEPAGRPSTDFYNDLAAAAARGSLDLSRGSLDLSPMGSPDGSSAALSYFPSTSSLGQQQNGGPADPHYNPPFWNDVLFKDRGWMRNMWHFAKKRKIEGSSLIEAATNHLVCHMQYGKSLTDFRGLHDRYESVRRLEDVDEIADQQQSQGGSQEKARVRFVNYFTISTGRDKTPSRTPSRSPSRGRSPARLSMPGNPGVFMAEISTRSPSASIGPSSPLREVSPRPMPDSESTPVSPSLPRRQSGFHLHPDDGRGDGADTPRISIEDHSNIARPKLVEVINSPTEKQQQPAPDASLAEETGAAGTAAPADDQKTEPQGTTDETGGDKEGVGAAVEGLKKLELDLESGLDPIPERPEEPQQPVLAADTSAEDRKKADKEHMRARKAYLEAIKAREKAIRERQKTIEKRRAKMEKEEAKKEKEEKKRQQTEEKRREKEEQKQEKERLKREKDEAKRVADEQKRMEEEAKKLAQGTQGQGQGEEISKAAEGGTEKESGSGSSESVDRNVDLAKQDAELRQAAEGVVAGTSAAATASMAAQQQRHGEETDESTKKAKEAEEAKKNKKPRKFCTLPKKPGGGRDSQWVEVFMEGVDEIGAHTGLFQPGPHYERLLGDLGLRIVGWVQDDATKRAILEGQQS